LNSIEPRSIQPSGVSACTLFVAEGSAVIVGEGNVDILASCELTWVSGVVVAMLVDIGEATIQATITTTIGIMKIDFRILFIPTS
jgi:hypothetical protein